MFQYLSFRAAAAVIIALLIGMIFGGRIINALRRAQIGETVRDLGLAGQLEKKGTPTMGGLIIIAAILIPVLLVGDLSNIYLQLMVFSTLWLGSLGFADDYIKVFRKDKDGNDRGADFISCVAFGRTAENLEKFSGKGLRVAVTGSITTGSYEKDGQKVFTTEITANKVEFIDWKEGGQKQPQKPAEPAPEGFAWDDESIPF